MRIQSREEETTLARWVLIDCSQVVPHSVEGESLCADTVTAQGAGGLTVLNAAPPSQHSQDDGAMQDASAKKRRKEAGAEIAPASAPQVSAQSSAADGAAAAAALPAAARAVPQMALRQLPPFQQLRQLPPPQPGFMPHALPLPQPGFMRSHAARVAHEPPHMQHAAMPLVRGQPRHFQQWQHFNHPLRFPAPRLPAPLLPPLLTRQYRPREAEWGGRGGGGGGFIGAGRPFRF